MGLLFENRLDGQRNFLSQEWYRMIADLCQWEPERSAMTPAAVLLSGKKTKGRDLLALPFLYQGIAATPESSPFPVEPGTDRFQAPQIAPANHSGATGSFPVPVKAGTEDRRRVREGVE
jgi:hypothetical protein